MAIQVPQFHQHRTLSAEQKIAFDKYVQGRNIFITGPGGTGKSALIRNIYEHATTYGRDISVCALTGCAAVLLGCRAKTIHSWAGLGLATGDIDVVVKRIMKKFFKVKVWRETKVLVIDEVSMMSKHLFELLDGIGKATRKSQRPFGGIQLIFSGDFYQLPPVGCADTDPDSRAFCFESPLWDLTFRPEDHISLVKIFRQKDPLYGSILNQVREGKIRKSAHEALMQRVGVCIPTDHPIKPTKLFPIRRKVDEINAAEMAALPDGTETRDYEIKYLRDLPMTESERLYRSTMSEERIAHELQSIRSSMLCDDIVRLKVGAQVMCVVNFSNDAVMKQMITSLDRSNAKERRYVTDDKDKGNNGIDGIDGIDSIDSGDELAICNGSQGIITGFDKYNQPIVQFNSGIQVTIARHVWESETVPGLGVSQIPLILAWALTIHKSQGATLELAEVDVGSGIFECGQTYVALSRVKSLDGLFLKSYDVTKICINKKVRDFYDRMKQLMDEKDKEKENGSSGGSAYAPIFAKTAAAAAAAAQKKGVGSGSGVAWKVMA